VLRPHALDGGAASRHWLASRSTSPPTPHRTTATPRPSRAVAPTGPPQTASPLPAQALKAAASPTREHTVPRRAPSKARHRASPPSCSPSQRTLLAPALDRPEACTLACCPGRATPSPAPELQRRPPPASAEPHHRRRPDPDFSHHRTRGEPLVIVPHSPDQLRRRPCRSPASRAATRPQRPNCLASFLLKGLCVNGRHSCEPSDLPGGHS
jgi:hypothetical protein